MSILCLRVYHSQTRGHRTLCPDDAPINISGTLPLRFNPDRPRSECLIEVNPPNQSMLVVQLFPISPRDNAAMIHHHRRGRRKSLPARIKEGLRLLLRYVLFDRGEKRNSVARAMVGNRSNRRFVPAGNQSGFAE
jgi:hypothetical protein